VAVFRSDFKGYSVDLSGGGTGVAGPDFEFNYEKHSSTSFGLYSDSENYIAFGGTGLRYQVKSGQVQDLIGGTITSLKLVYEGHTVLLMSDLKLPAAKFFDVVSNGSSQDVFDQLFSGNDTVYGTAYGDVLLGGRGNDILKGGGGGDKLGGQSGADDLYGQGGKDVFLFKSVKDSTVSSSGRDTIFDFSVSQGDTINLSAIDANKNSDGNQAFKFIGTDKFSGKAGELRFDLKTSDTYVYVDVNGDKVADLSIHLDDRIALHKADFVL
jgi:Ca2+-binding RTX toxin-like protein